MLGYILLCTALFFVTRFAVFILAGFALGFVIRDCRLAFHTGEVARPYIQFFHAFAFLFAMEAGFIG